MNQETRTCQNCQERFVIDPEDFDFYQKIAVPPPTFCPDCRLVRRLAWRNMRSLYKRKCDLCGQEKIGAYSPDKPFKVYCSPCWWGDGWNGEDSGRGYDPSLGFFPQLRQLMAEAPLLGRFVYEDTMVRSDYANMANNLKDCYLVFNSGGKVAPCERVAYADRIDLVNDSFDLSGCSKCELCYRSVGLHNCYKVFYSRDSESCQDSWFLRNCTGCHDCFGCSNLRNKSYCIWNEQYSKEGYFEKLQEMGFQRGSFESTEKFRLEAGERWMKEPVKYYQGLQNNRVSGDNIFNCKNVQHSFYCSNVEDSKYCSYLFAKVRDSYDWTQYGDGGELCYELAQAGEGVYNDRFGWCIWRQAKNCEYGMLNVNCSDCFGCIGLKNKRFCILNKQYTEEEYKELRARIVADMEQTPYVDAKGRTWKYGEFFPYDLLPFGYNETTAQDEFPLDEQAALEKGYPWQDTSKFKGVYEITKAAKDLPDNIAAAGEDILKEVIGCAVCSRAFRMIPMELAFYKNQELPLPRLCPECRYAKRRELMNPLRVWPRRCACTGSGSQDAAYRNTVQHFHGDGICPNEFEAAYAPERPEILYCEECYNAEVV